MQEEYNPLETFIKTFTETITKQLYTDIKGFAVSQLKPLKKVVTSIKKKKYPSIPVLLSDLSTGKLKNGSIIEIECKFSSFGPSVKPLYIGPLIGMNSQNRLGPPLINLSNPMIGMVAQTMSNLIPVGLYPPVSEKVSQVRLYPANAEVLGFYSLFPEVNNLVPSLNALIKPEYLLNAHKNCRLIGRVRFVSQLEFVHAGFNLEDFEVLRSLGNIWFLDATDEDSTCKSMETEIHELWGALYSAGHLEFKGELPVEALINQYLEKLSPHVKNLQVVQNQARNKEINIFGQGFRMVQHINFPIYALHYDINIGTNYSSQRAIYDNILNSVLQAIKETCDSTSVQLFNPFDLDFNYANSGESFRLLESIGANNIQDPLGIAIRQWVKKDSISPVLK